MKRAPENPDEKDQGRPKGVSRRELLRSGGTAGLAGVAATTIAGALLPTPTADAADNTPPDPGGPEPDDSRQDLGGMPIRDIEPFGEEDAMALPPLRERVLALRDLLVNRGVILQRADQPAPTIDFFVDFYENRVGPQLGKMVVAHAWTNPDFRHALLNPPADKPFDATRVVAEFLAERLPLRPLPGSLQAPAIPQAIGSRLGPEGEWLRVVANGPDPATGKHHHHMNVCTVCSCYPQALLGVQPIFYKSQQYRSRAITAPRGVLREFAAAEDEKAREEQREERSVERLEAYLARVDEIQVHDSNSEVRYLVLPEMPEAWAKEGLSEEELCDRVTRNSMIGVSILG